MVMFLNLFGSDGPPGAHAGVYRNRFLDCYGQVERVTSALPKQRAEA
ncbi:MAG: hypothetical protein JWR14_4378 [Caballeronia sp.]|jgi:hypothetical protein|nr:hypothetical protein [Caballeronia sp.]